MNTDQIRTAFLDYFKSKGHAVVASSSLVPAGDPTLLFTNAGMVQFKDCFLGSDKRPYNRATTCQKCLRISGKHNDLENVGRTARHHTFFEMLGNFSFGDYFKLDAIKFGWEFLTVTLGLDKRRLWVTVYEDDDEAERLWYSETDVIKGRVLRCGKEDNFWAMGDTGPCGPCSEIHYYLGDDLNDQSEHAFRTTDGLYFEIWNLVFMQFNRDVAGSLTPLPKPSVDTGMGLERIAAVKQGVVANYDTDLLRGIIRYTEELSGKSYLGKDYTPRDTESDGQYAVDVAHRVVADHVRACSFLIADGVTPGSDGRGYVLRRLIRRACRHGRNLGLREPFLHKVALKVVAEMSAAYPELEQGRKKIERLILAEEQKFAETLDSGMAILRREVATLRERSARVLPGRLAFELHDTYGFPLDLTEDIVRGFGLSVDTAGFEAAMEEQRERSRSARSAEGDLVLQRAVKPMPTEFVGREYLEYESTVSGLFGNTGELKFIGAGGQVALVVPETPFYAESGGQIGDTGTISSNSSSLEVLDTQKGAGGTIVHICRVVEGELSVGDKVRLSVSPSRRQRLAVNHSATHLLHLALREVLGSHVKQAGSRVSDTGLRFDFSHFEPITDEQLAEIESIVNGEIRANYPVQTEVLPIEEARRSGAVALFDEKYGELVRVVQIGPRSREFCGGTHTTRSGDIGVLSLLAEGSVAAGVRRVEAVAGAGATQYISQQQQQLRSLATLLRSGERDLVERVRRLVEHEQVLERELGTAVQRLNQIRGGDLTSRARTLTDGTKVVASIVEKASPKQLREMADDLRARLGSSCIALGSVSEGKAVVLTAVSDDLVDRYHAGNLLREISGIFGGKGGGKAQLAQAGGGDPEKLGQALERFEQLLT